MCVTFGVRVEFGRAVEPRELTIRTHSPGALLDQCYIAIVPLAKVEVRIARWGANFALHEQGRVM